MRFWTPPFSMGKEKDILENLFKIADSVYESVAALDSAVKAFTKGDYKQALIEAKNCSLKEKKADDDRRILERSLYTEGFLPFSREDYFNLSEAIDDIADQAEKASFWLTFKEIKVPRNIKPLLIELSEKTVKTVALLKEIIDKIGHRSHDLISATQLVDREREDVREIATKLGREIFKNVKSNEAYLMWELVYRIMSVADRAEEASDRIVTITMKMVE